MKIVGCMANRQIARALKVSPATVDRHLSRIARQCMLFHMQQIAGRQPRGDLVVDGFETFELSQYFPIHHHVAVEADSSFFLYFTDSPLRRKGRMTCGQKKRRQELEAKFGRPDPKAITKDMGECLQVALTGRQRAVVRSDDHPGYLGAIRKQVCRIVHEVTPGKAHRDKRNRLWEVNLLDMLIRHSSSNHKRETIAWSKRRQSSAERLVIFLVWRNYLKRRWEKKERRTPGMLAGVVDRVLVWRDVFGERLFRSQVWLPPRWRLYYDRLVRTVALEVNRRHELRYAY